VTIEMGMRRLARRTMAVALSAGFVTLLATSPARAESASIATHTTLTTDSQQTSGREVITYSAAVAADDDSATTGVVTLMEGNRSLASAAVDSTGKAEIRFGGLSTGDHLLRAVYSGDSAHAASQSSSVKANATIASDSFGLTISPTSVTVAAPGDAADVVATVAGGTDFTGFVSFSCAGAPVSTGSSTDSSLPVGVSCTFTPTNVEITSAGGSATSHFTVQTTAPAGQNGWNRRPNGPQQGPDRGGPLMLAVLLPGVIGLGFLGRKRKVLGRVALVLLVGAVSVLGTTACNARYKYLNHPPTANDGTATGTYTLTVWAQTSNGVTASEQQTSLTLVVN
jgi:hypothetical protein